MKKKYVILLLFGLAFVFALWEYQRRSDPRVVFFDVGQGDSIFIQGREHVQVLIDGGPDKTIVQKLSRTLPLFDRTIELVVLTHGDLDHLSGLIEVLKRYRVQRVLFIKEQRDEPAYNYWLELIREKGIEVIEARSGQNFQLTDGAFLEVLSPSAAPPALNQNGTGPAGVTDFNDYSVVTRYQTNQKSFLFLADVSTEVQDKLTVNRFVLPTDIVKAAHHGSRYSFSNKLINQTEPELVVIQVGKNNRYGHPSAYVLEQLRKLDINIWRTDQQGDLSIPTP